jgi:hypothetical protein
MQNITHQASNPSHTMSEYTTSRVRVWAISIRVPASNQTNSSIKNASLHMSRNGHLGIVSLARTRRASTCIATLSPGSTVSSASFPKKSRMAVPWIDNSILGIKDTLMAFNIINATVPLPPDRRFENYTGTASKPSVSGPNFRASGGRTIGRKVFIASPSRSEVRSTEHPEVAVAGPALILTI